MSDELSDEQRRHIFASANEHRSSTLTLKKGRRRPPKVALWVIGAVVVLGVGGQFANHYLANLGANAPPSSSTTTLAPTTPQHPGTSNFESFIGYRPIGTASATDFSLRDQRDQRWTLSAHRRQVVIVAFYNANCLDICPVVGAELRSAYLSLGSRSPRVTIAIVNTDPRDTRVRSAPAALVIPKLTGHANVVFLTGTLRELDSVWTAYGVTVSVGARANQISHSNVIYFIGPNTTLAGLAQPFAKIAAGGHYSLSSSKIARYAKGVVQVADSLVG